MRRSRMRRSLSSTMKTPVRGFTLIELLVVIAIIGLLSAVVLASLNTARAKGMDAQRVSNLRNIQNALELYASDHSGQYPVSTNQNCWTGWDGQVACAGGLAPNNVIPGLVPAYMPSFPTDPQIDKVNNLCDYLYISNGTDYKLLFHQCPTSNICYGAGEIKTSFYDPQRPTWACQISTPGAVQQGW